MHHFLFLQDLSYQIFVIEQVSNDPFNRAALFNVGFKEINKLNFFNCFIFHDVDLFPENIKNKYNCYGSPSHLSVSIDSFNYRLPYKTNFGGVVAFLKDHFEKVNGFSNSYWGWGAEDDDMWRRPSVHIARYKANKIEHKRDEKPHPIERLKLLEKAVERIKFDGLSNLSNYTIENQASLELYTIYRVNLSGMREYYLQNRKDE